MADKQKLFNIRLEAAMHKQLRYISFEKEISMHQFIIEAIQEKLAKEGKK
ncbi:Arc-like repressor [Bacillus phage Palmer]|uniref:Uncharacterized protein n=2 Tax=Pagevirus TaxID=1921184 RepID=A0A0A0RNW4_9CAUD|nr:Arc-like repressor [Bacillus phage Pookie]YP_009210072.1 Arc-like repressor [Bacillus phage Palmer]AIW03722.1 hypothetical protein CPT_Pookie37 [Bacillus phage Pookie]AJK28104.1 transcriptional regulator [Bacillus phage Palmer]